MKTQPSQIAIDPRITAGRIELVNLLNPVVFTRSPMDVGVTCNSDDPDSVDVSYTLTPEGALRIEGKKPIAGSFKADLRKVLVFFKLTKPTNELAALKIGAPPLDLYIRHCANISGRIDGGIDANLNDGDNLRMIASGEVRISTAGTAQAAVSAPARH